MYCVLGCRPVKRTVWNTVSAPRLEVCWTLRVASTVEAPDLKPGPPPDFAIWAWAVLTVVSVRHVTDCELDGSASCVSTIRSGSVVGLCFSAAG